MRKLLLMAVVLCGSLAALAAEPVAAPQGCSDLAVRAENLVAQSEIALEPGDRLQLALDAIELASRHGCEMKSFAESREHVTRGLHRCARHWSEPSEGMLSLGATGALRRNAILGLQTAAVLDPTDRALAEKADYLRFLLDAGFNDSLLNGQGPLRSRAYYMSYGFRNAMTRYTLLDVEFDGRISAYRWLMDCRSDFQESRRLDFDALMGRTPRNAGNSRPK